MTTEKRITLCIPSRHDHVALLGQALQGLLQEKIQDKGELYLLELALCEAAVNCIRHAYADKPGHIVQVEIILGPNELHFRIQDQGSSLSRQKLFQAELQDPEQDLPVQECGRGLGLIQAIMDQVDYSSSSGWNCLWMRKTLLQEKVCKD
ncbi:MAG: ATP-binding protein [Thermodesulfobacteriota bacterium]